MKMIGPCAILSNKWMTHPTTCHVICICLLDVILAVEKHEPFVLKVPSQKYRSSQCHPHFRHGVDRYFVLGSAFRHTDWNSSVHCQIKKQYSNKWEPLCSIDLSHCKKVQVYETLGCSCFGQHKHGYRRVTFNMTVDFSWNGGFLRMVLDNEMTHSAEVTKLPSIWRQEIETLAVNRKLLTLPLEKSECKLQLPNDGKSKLQYCVTYLSNSSELSISSKNKSSLWSISAVSVPCVRTAFEIDEIKPRGGLSPTMDHLLFKFKESDVCKRHRQQECEVYGSGSGIVRLSPFSLKDSSSRCTIGVVERDFYYFKGYINTKRIDTSIRKTIFDVEFATPGSDFNLVNFIDATENGPGCSRKIYGHEFYCLKVEDGVYHIRLNLTANVHLKGIIRLKWRKMDDSGSADTSQGQILPQVFRQNKFTLQTLSMQKDSIIYKTDLHTADPSQPWNLQMTRNVTIRMVFCVRNYTFCRMSISINGEIFASSYNQSCIDIVHLPGCNDVGRTFSLQYVELTGCRRMNNFYNKGIIPVLKVNQSVIDIEMPNCMLQWIADSSNTVVEFCAINLSRPYTLSAILEMLVLNSTGSQCLMLTRIPFPGVLIFKLRTGCDMEPQYSCKVDMEGDFVEAVIKVNNDSIDVYSHYCEIVLEKDQSVSMSFCILHQIPPYVVNISLPSSGKDQTVEEITDRCVQFYYTPYVEATSLFSFTDSTNLTRVFKCAVTFPVEEIEDENLSWLGVVVVASLTIILGIVYVCITAVRSSISKSESSSDLDTGLSIDQSSGETRHGGGGPNMLEIPSRTTVEDSPPSKAKQQMTLEKSISYDFDKQKNINKPKIAKWAEDTTA